MFRLPVLFLACALPLGLLLAALVPTGEVPDETAHIVRAYAVSTGQWVGRRMPAPNGGPIPQSGYEIDRGLFGISFASSEPGGKVTAALAERRRTTGWAGATVFADVPNTGSYAPVLYLLSGAAFAAGHAAGLSPALTTEAARLANLAGFAALGFAALAWAARMRFVLFALLCLPSSLSLAASVNQDGLLIGFAVLAAALLTRPEPAARRWAAAAVAVVCLAKPPYLPLVALLAVPRGPWRWRALLPGAGLAVLAALPAVLWSLAALRWTVVPFATPPYAPGPLYAGSVATFAGTDSAAQLAILSAEPARFVLLPLRTLATWWRAWLHEVVGVLGQLSLVLPGWLYQLWFVALGGALAADVLTARPDAPRPRFPDAVVAVAAVLASAFLVFVVQYLTWTHVGEDSVAGVQGRYFVPLLAALALAVPVLPAVRGRRALLLLALPAFAAAPAGLLAIPARVVRQWYLS